MLKYAYVASMNVTYYSTSN